jgi:hypothetical protein
MENPVMEAALAHRLLFPPVGVANPEVLVGHHPLTQRDADAAYWFGTLHYQEHSHQEVLRRMWAIIWHGGLWARHKGAWTPWHDGGLPVASCLSHGGRVLVQLRRDSGEGVWNWLWGGSKYAVVQPETRSGATHDVEFGTFDVMPDGRHRRVREIKKRLGGRSGAHFGINLAGGGLGFINPVSDNVILADGRHGHLYIFYVAPTPETAGALMFAAEDTAPYDRTDFKLNQAFGWAAAVGLLPLTVLDLASGGGTLHQPWSPGLRGIFPRGQAPIPTYHGLGASGKYSITGGGKFKALAKRYPDLNLPTGDDAMFVNPPASVWEKLLNNELAFDEEDLGDPPPAPQMAAPDMPTQEEFKTATYVSALHKRNKWLTAMDKSLDEYYHPTHASKRRAILDRFWHDGRQYLNDPSQGDPPKVRAQVQEFISIASRLAQMV